LVISNDKFDAVISAAYATVAVLVTDVVNSAPPKTAVENKTAVRDKLLILNIVLLKNKIKP